jgi:MFS transporter, YNFM family, putative membrane transport protein
VLLASIVTMIAGVAIIVSNNVVAVLVGLVITTAGFFGAHAVASGWVGGAAADAKAQASSLYNLFYYGGSSTVGWFGGVAFDAAGWTALAGTVIGLAALAGLLALTLRR